MRPRMPLRQYVCSRVQSTGSKVDGIEFHREAIVGPVTWYEERVVQPRWGPGLSIGHSRRLHDLYRYEPHVLGSVIEWDRLNPDLVSRFSCFDRHIEVSDDRVLGGVVDYDILLC